MNIEFVRLYDAYSSLLSERQREIMNLYYNEDESLSEISENVGITRQGVRDCIVKTEAQLTGYENALRLAERTELFEKAMEKLRNEAEKSGCTQLVQMIDEITASFENNGTE